MNLSARQLLEQHFHEADAALDGLSRLIAEESAGNPETLLSLAEKKTQLLAELSKFTKLIEAGLTNSGYQPSITNLANQRHERALSERAGKFLYRVDALRIANAVNQIVIQRKAHLNRALANVLQDARDVSSDTQADKLSPARLFTPPSGNGRRLAQA